MMRSSSFVGVDVAISREINSNFDIVKLVSNDLALGSTSTLLVVKNNIPLLENIIDNIDIINTVTLNIDTILDSYDNAISSKSSEDASALSETNALNYSSLAADWAEKGDLDVDGVGTRSSKYHADMSKSFNISAETHSINTAADLVKTNQDVVDTTNNVNTTNANVLLTDANVVKTEDDVSITNANVVLTNADSLATSDNVVTTNNNVISTTQSAQAALLSETNAAASALAIQTLNVVTGTAGGLVVFDNTTNTLTVPRGSTGVNGVDGMTPQYEFIYNAATGDLEYNLLGHIPSTAATEQEW